MKVDVYNQENKKVSEIELSDAVFGIKWNAGLVHQALIAHMSNAREPIAHAKGRGDVRGGGKKPWKQKGTGRARHGSTRSPIWIGGGVAHGPLKEKDYSKKLNKKMKTLALFSVLSKKIKDNEIKVVEKIETGNKTKEWTGAIKNITDLRSKNLLILDSATKNSANAISNIRNVEAMGPKSLNVYDLLKNKFIVIESKAVEQIEKHFYKA